MTLKNILLSTLLLTGMTMSSCHMPGQGNGRMDTNDYSKYKGIYTVAEYLDDDAYDSYVNDDGTMFQRLLGFHDLLKASDTFDYYAYANNIIEVIDTDIPDECILNHGTEFAKDSRYEFEGNAITATEAIQISENYADIFPIKVTEGRFFEEEDFDCLDNEEIHVLLGNGFKDSFDIGDTFEAYYIFERKIFKVIGFISPDSEFYLKSRNALSSFDGYVVMPFANIKDDSYVARRILLQQTSGYIVPETDRESALKAYEKCLREASLESWIPMVGMNEMDLCEALSRVYR